MKFTPSELPKLINAQTPIPRNTYVIQCLSEELKESPKSGNKYVSRQWQIISPETIKIGEQEYMVAGVQVNQMRMVHQSEANDPENHARKTQRYAVDFCDEAAMLGIDCSQYDSEAPPIACEGLVANAVLGPDQYTLTKDITPEEIEQGKKEGEPIIDEATGKPVVGYKVKLQRILGLNKTVKANPI